MNNTKRIIVRVLGGASLNSLSVAWVSRWGSCLKEAWASLPGFVLWLLRTYLWASCNPYPPLFVFEEVRFNAHHKWFVFNRAYSINREHKWHQMFIFLLWISWTTHQALANFRYCPSCLKNDTCFKCGQKWLENNQLSFKYLFVTHIEQDFDVCQKSSLDLIEKN